MSNDQKDRIVQVGHRCRGKIFFTEAFVEGKLIAIMPPDHLGAPFHVLDDRGNCCYCSEVHPLPVEQPKDEPLSEKQVEMVMEVAKEVIGPYLDEFWNAELVVMEEKFRSRLLDLSTTR